MNAMGLTAVVVGMMAKLGFGLSLVNLQHEGSLQSQTLESVLGAAGLEKDSLLSEFGFQTVAKLRDDETMSEFVKRILAVEDKYVPQDQEGELSGFVQWFSGTKATQSYQQMRSELSDKSWVKDLKAVDGATLSEMDYQAVASRRNNTAMILLCKALLKSVNKFVPFEERNEFGGFVPWFSGMKAVQSLQVMREELLQKPWVQAMKAVGSSRKETKAATETSNNQTAAARIEKKNQTKIEDAEHSVKSESVQTRLMKARSLDVDEPGSDVAVAAQCADCIVWGEANILSFNANRIRANTHPDRALELHARKEKHDQFTLSEEGTYWLVNSKDVQIQGRYWQYNHTRRGLGLGAIAVGGPMVGNSTLIIRALRGPVTWNGQEILHAHPSKFSNAFVKADYVADVGPVAGDTHVPGIKFIFSSGVNLTVSRYRNKLSARVSLCESDSGAAAAESQCGTLKRTPRSKANAFFAAQRKAVKLPGSEIIFPDGAVNSRRKRQ